MSFLLDTNVVSEPAKPRPDPGLTSWLTSVDEDRTFLSVVTFAEISFVIERCAMGEQSSNAGCTAISKLALVEEFYPLAKPSPRRGEKWSQSARGKVGLVASWTLS